MIDFAIAFVCQWTVVGHLGEVGEDVQQVVVLEDRLAVVPVHHPSTSAMEEGIAREENLTQMHKIVGKLITVQV